MSWSDLQAQVRNPSVGTALGDEWRRKHPRVDSIQLLGSMAAEDLGRLLPRMRAGIVPYELMAKETEAKAVLAANPYLLLAEKHMRRTA